MVSLARKNLLHDRLRFVITVAGVAFAVTLVLVQVGLFMGLLDKSTVTIQQRRRRPLDHVAQHAERRLRAHLPGDGACCACAASPGVERADNLIVSFMNIAAAERRARGRARLRARGLQGVAAALERAGGRARGPAARRTAC